MVRASRSRLNPIRAPSHECATVRDWIFVALGRDPEDLSGSVERMFTNTELQLFQSCIDGDLSHICNLLADPNILADVMLSKSRPCMRKTQMGRFANITLMINIAARRGFLDLTSMFVAQAQESHVRAPVETAEISAAIDGGDINIFKLLLSHQEFPLPADRTMHRRHLLFSAIRKTSTSLEFGLECMRLLLAIPDPPRTLTSSRQQHNNDALHFAAACDSSAAMELMLEHGAEINVVGADSRALHFMPFHTPLHCAFRKNNIEAATWLLEHGADQNLCDVPGYSAWHFARNALAKDDNGELLEILHEAA